MDGYQLINKGGKMGKIIRNGIEFCGTSDTADNIIYDNSESGLEATTTQAAIDKLNDSLTNEDNETFNFGVKDGVRGFYTDPSRADDSFIPFSSSKIVTGEFNAGSKVLMIDLGFKPKFLYVVNKDFSQLRIYDESYSSEKIFSHTISASEGAFNSLPNSEANNIQSITDNGFTYGIVTSESFKAKRYVAFK